MKFSNVKLVLFPPNTTSHLQPLDQGIIKTMKTHCRQLFFAQSNQGCRRRWVTSDNEQVTSDDEQVTSDNEQVTNDNEQVTSDNEQVTNDNEQVTSDNEQVTNDVAPTDNGLFDENDDSDDEGEESETRPDATIREAVEMAERLRDFFLSENMSDSVQVTTQMNNSLLEKTRAILPAG
ncbi:M protein, serotype 6-like [Penaeus vannamei]|uniref:M protein, serotype 6-like n=1 Tax=Penaeus vannamei TaxID=6689 RepID=UPI00387F86AC